MNTTSPIRVRFAPAPTGLMHLGNVRTALMNFIFARQNNGAFIIRVEDTDAQRNFDPGAQQILKDLEWLSLAYDEGPGKGGPHAPYFQSERAPIYQEKLQQLISKDAVYRCFCTEEELERKRERQIALKMPPRYDRACLNLSSTVIDQNLKAGKSFIWRFKVPHHGAVIISDIARGNIHFEYKNFSDAPLTRADGSFNFIFANFVDDMEMRITHIFRGEDHLTNTAVQAVMYAAFQLPLPTYWHMPIICNIQGKKLSKRDFGFSLNDLREAGYLPEAICNYLAIIGGSFMQEIMAMPDLIKTSDFTQLSTAGQIKYDVEKLTWVNHQWIINYNPDQLAQHTFPILLATFPQAATMDKKVLASLLQTIKSDLQTLKDCTQALHFYFVPPAITKEQLAEHMKPEISSMIAGSAHAYLHDLSNPEQFVNALKTAAKERQIVIKDLFVWLRLALMGQPHGPTIVDLIKMLGAQEAEARIKKMYTQ